MNTVHGLYATPEDPAPPACSGARRGMDRRALQRPRALPVGGGPRVGAAAAAWRGAGRSVHLGNGIDLSRSRPSLRRRGAGAQAPRRARDRRGRAGRRDRRPDGPREGLRGALRGGARPCASRVPNARFLVVGEGDPDKRTLSPPSRSSGPATTFVFTGWREDVADLMALMDVFVLPSWREGMPRSAIEAAASGLAAGAHGHPRMPRGGARRRRGFLVPVRDPSTAGRRDPCASWRTRRSGDGWAPPRARARERRFDERRVAATVVDATTALLAARPDVSVDADVGGSDPSRPASAMSPPMARLHRESMPTAFLPDAGRPVPATPVSRDDARPPGGHVGCRRGGAVVGFAAAVPSVRASTGGSLCATASLPGSPRPRAWCAPVSTGGGSRPPISVGHGRSAGGGVVVDRGGRGVPLEGRRERARGRRRSWSG